MRHGGAGVMHGRNVPALSGRRPLNPLLIDLERRRRGVIAFNGGAKTILEVEPADFSVADDIEPDIFLQPDGRAHRIILDCVQCLRCDLALVERNARLPHCHRPQQTAHNVGTDFCEFRLIFNHNLYLLHVGSDGVETPDNMALYNASVSCATPPARPAAHAQR